MKIVFGFKTLYNSAVFTVTEDQDVFVRHVNNHGRVEYDGKWEDCKGFSSEYGSLRAKRIFLLNLCVRVNRPLLEELHDLLVTMGH